LQFTEYITYTVRMKNVSKCGQLSGADDRILPYSTEPRSNRKTLKVGTIEHNKILDQVLKYGSF